MTVTQTKGSAAPPAPPAPPGGRRRPNRHPDNAWAAILLAVPFAGLVIFYLWPLLRTVLLSLSEGTAFTGYTVTGFDNWRQLFEGDDVWRALVNTLVYAAIVLLGVPLAMVIAALLHQKGLRGRSFYRTLYFVPVVTMPVAVAMVWRYIYNGDFGLLNEVLDSVGGPTRAWVADPDTALYAVAVVGIWMALGTNLIILAAGLEAVPETLEEAAMLDGAGPIRRFFSVTVPLLTPSIFLVSVLSVIGSLQMFDLLFIMLGRTNPALADSKTIVYLFYEEAFVRNDRPLGAVIALVTLVVTLAVTAVQFRLQRRWVTYA
ncbi:carbohydrate ABC transporter permease [Jiangella mangrovi]|uniref:Multiple sugar transport system permease protein n=1 Tax=Jiangella mangrovi TaxID=1524084 RepID=A0A7W9GWH8_9ACTN|nr:sugar ABC transporter permease [Jiangella mangrovi]MBB5791329.1 multiple sugar transport system permease protein [Jiangella mangrovi]